MLDSASLATNLIHITLPLSQDRSLADCLDHMVCLASQDPVCLQVVQYQAQLLIQADFLGRKVRLGFPFPELPMVALGLICVELRLVYVLCLPCLRSWCVVLCG